jgi:hypothetical protein
MIVDTIVGRVDRWWSCIWLQPMSDRSTAASCSVSPHSLSVDSDERTTVLPSEHIGSNRSTLCATPRRMQQHRSHPRILGIDPISMHRRSLRLGVQTAISAASTDSCVACFLPFDRAQLSGLFVCSACLRDVDGCHAADSERIDRSMTTEKRSVNDCVHVQSREDTNLNEEERTTRSYVLNRSRMLSDIWNMNISL